MNRSAANRVFIASSPANPNQELGVRPRVSGVEATSIDEIAQEQQPVDLRDRPSLVDRSQASKVGGEVPGFFGRQALRSKIAVGGECCRPAFGPVPWGSDGGRTPVPTLGRRDASLGSRLG